MAIEHVTDHVEQADGLLISQYKNRPRMSALLASYVGQVQELEDAAWDVLIKRLIDNATGEQLEVIGRLVGEPRGGRNDVDYAVRIGARILINKSQGKAGDVLGVIDALYQRTTGTTLYTYADHVPATMVLTWILVPTIPIREAIAYAREAKGAGVGLILIAPTTTSSKVFAFRDYYGSNDPNKGCGDYGSPDTFGLLSTAVR